MPAYNEEKHVGKVVKEIPRKVKGIHKVEVLVIDDGSSDKTSKVAKRAGADRIIRHKRNMGVGRVFKDGIEEALRMGADVIVNIDADDQFDTKDVPRLVAPILTGDADFVTATRFSGPNGKNHVSWVKARGNRFFTGLVNWLTKNDFTDTQCGFRAFSRDAALRLNLYGNFTYTQEVFLSLARKDINILEVPVKVKYDVNRSSRVVSSSTGYGLKALWIILLTLKDYRPLAFFGTLGGIVFTSGFICGAFVFLHWLLTGFVSPYTSMVSLSSALMVIGSIFVILALIADMMGRQRRIQEELLYYAKKREYGNGSLKRKKWN